MAAMPELRPSVGFCLQTVTTASPPGRWYLNMCKHKMCEMPVAYSGKVVDRDFILAHGIGNMKVPFDIGSFRKVKERAEGARQTTFCIDAIFNPLIIKLFQEDDFCKKLENFRPFVINLVLTRIEESVGVKLASDQIKLVKALRYKDGEGNEGGIPREFADLPGNADCFDKEVERPQRKNVEPEPLIQDITPGVKKKPALKKGFLNNSKNTELYPDGSGEGVLPENAGDPMGYIPKGLRNKCKIVDCNSPEYQENEKQRKAAESQNDMSQQMQNDIKKWSKQAERDKWGEDTPDGVARPEDVKYSNDYSRFDTLPDVEEAPVTEGRDWYSDTKGNIHRVGQVAPATSSPYPSAADGKEKDSALKKGFLDGVKKPLYPKGSEQAAPLSEDAIMKELMREQAIADLAASAEKAQEKRQASVSVKVPETKAPTFELTETSEGLQLAVAVPGLGSMQDVSLDVTERSASLAFPARAGLKPLQVDLPVAVVASQARAKFSKKTQHITIQLPAARGSA